MTRVLFMAALAAISFLAPADDAAVACSAPVAALLDTSGSPRAIKGAEELADLRPLTCRAGETVTLIAPDGTAVSLVEGAASDSVAWMPSSGGIWTVSNSVQGTATFTVRHSLFGAMPDPAQLVDADELADLVEVSAADDGFVFDLVEGAVGLDELALPNGYSVSPHGNGHYVLAAVADGSVWNGAPFASDIDTKSAGPDRKAYIGKTRSVSYSGDGWRGGAYAVSALTITSPSGGGERHEFSGTGSYPFRPAEEGVWLLTLNMADGTALESQISVFRRDFVVTIR